MTKLRSATSATAKCVATLIEQSGIKQKILAQKLNISESTMSQKMNGRVDFKISEICLLANFFHISADSLLGLKPLEVK